MPVRSSRFLVCLFLVVLTFAVFAQITQHGFLFYDDDKYVTENRHVQQGLTLASVSWAWTASVAANWHPLTLMSHMLDYDLYGLHPAGHHMTSVMIHAVNSVLLFLILLEMTGAFWRSAFVAALFAIHPLHVQSVAWVAERKDVLSGLFWSLAIWIYVRWVRAPRVWRYMLVLFCFALGLMSKPMVVTLPFLLIILDVWPLGRCPSWREVPGFVTEKIPLFILSLAACVMTWLTQIREGAIMPGAELHLGIRIENALLSYLQYMGKMFWPAHLTVFYPHRMDWFPLWQVLGAGVVLTAISTFAFQKRRAHPYLLAGWLWYLGTLVPVIGIIQIGQHAMADRYTYLPLTGLLIMLVWGGFELAQKVRIPKPVLALGTASIVLSLAVQCWSETRYWRDGITLFGRALKVTRDNYIAHACFGLETAARGNTPDAIEHFTKALEIAPYFDQAHNNLGVALEKSGVLAVAEHHFKMAIRANPGFARAYSNLGYTLFREEKLAESAFYLSRALQLDPDDDVSHQNMADTLQAMGKNTEAAFHYSEARRLNPAQTQSSHLSPVAPSGSPSQ